MSGYTWLTGWNSSFTSGIIIVVAPDVEKARNLALLKFDTEHANKESMFETGDRTQFIIDINKEPDEVGNVFLIYGSD